MQTPSLVRKCLAVGILLLLIGTTGISSTTLTRNTHLNQTEETIQGVVPQPQGHHPVWLNSHSDAQGSRASSHPPSTDVEWITYGGYNVNSLGVVGGYEPWEGAIRLTPQELSPYDGWSIVSVKYFHGYQGMAYPDPPSHGNMKIYGTGSATDPGVVLDSEPFWTPEGNAWFQFNLSNPVIINASQDYWFSVEILNQTAGDYPLGVDAGPAEDGKGDFCELGEGNWNEIQIYGLDWNWNHMVGLAPPSTLPPPIVHGPTDGWTHAPYTFWIDPITTPDEDQFYVKWDWGDGDTSEWLGPYSSGSAASASHTWTHAGVFGVRAKLAVGGNESDWSEPHAITIEESGPPLKPLISGPHVGRVGVAYNFTVSLTDPEGDEFFYKWDWGDGNSSGWLGPFASGQTVTVSHAWSKTGTYSILVKAKDPYGVESISEPFIIQIVKLKVSFAFGSFNNRSETDDLIIVHTNVLLLFPSHSLLSLGRTIVVAKQYLGFFDSFLFGGIFQAALLTENP